MSDYEWNLSLFLNGEAMVKIKSKSQFKQLVKIIEQNGQRVRKDYKKYKKRKAVMYYCLDCIGDLVYVKHNKKIQKLRTPRYQHFAILKIKDLKGE